MGQTAVIAQLTASGLLGRRRLAVLVVLPLVLLGLAGVVHAVGGGDPRAAAALLGGVALGTVVPLLCVVVGTGVIGPEIEDGSILYLLSKPLPRSRIVLGKLAVAVATAWVLLLPAVLVCGLVLAGTTGRLAVAYALAAAVAVVAYCALFLLLAVLTRNAVVVGSDAARLGVDSAVALDVGLVLLAVVSVSAVVCATARLRTLRLAGSEA